jgi:hypothetical protein
MPTGVGRDDAFGNALNATALAMYLQPRQRRPDSGPPLAPWAGIYRRYRGLGGKKLLPRISAAQNGTSKIRPEHFAVAAPCFPCFHRALPGLTMKLNPSVTHSS